MLELARLGAIHPHPSPFGGSHLVTTVQLCRGPLITGRYLLVQQLARTIDADANARSRRVSTVASDHPRRSSSTKGRGLQRDGWPEWAERSSASR